MAKKIEFTYASRDEINTIHAVKWIPENGQVKAILQIVHGMVEYIDRYNDFAEFLCEHGIMVVGNDHLGHGKTAKSREDFGYFADKDGSTIVVRDVHRLKKIVEEENPGVPYFILGFSMGSYILRKYLTWYGRGIKGAIIAGVGQDGKRRTKNGLMLIKILKCFGGSRRRSKLVHKCVMGKYNDRISPVRTKSDWLCRDEAVVDKYENDPYCSFIFTLGGYEDLLKMSLYDGQDEPVSRIPKDLPVLILAGSEDPVGQYGAKVKVIYDQYLRSGMKYVAYQIYEGYRHEILNEIDKEKVYLDVLNWIEANML